MQLDASYQLDNAHTPRFGGSFTHQYTQSNNTVQAFPTDDAGSPTSDVPLTIVDNSSKSGNLLGLYVQDEWRINPSFTLNYGIRFDRVAAFTTEQQWSPRINALYKITDATAIHAGYARIFHAAAAGARVAIEHRTVREYDQRARDSLFGRRQGGENELFRCRHRAEDHAPIGR